MNTNFENMDDLMRQRPEWAPWLAVVGSALDEIGAAGISVVLHADLAPEAHAPLLANATVEIEAGAAHRVVNKLLRAAARSGSAPMRSLERVAATRTDAIGILEAVLNRDRNRISRWAQESGADAEAFVAVAALGAMPFLHACSRVSGHRQSWTHGYCPVCGDWPAFAEMRGVERSRYYRCSACGSEWETLCLKCAFCGTTDHDTLGSLVPQDEKSRAALDVCNACRGYVKVLTTLCGAAPAQVALHDLATAELDAAAAERGYDRSRHAGYALGVRVVERGARPRSA